MQGKEGVNSIMLTEKNNSAKEAPNKLEDVLAKIIRVLANLMISEDVGPSIASNSNFQSTLLAIIGKY